MDEEKKVDRSGAYYWQSLMDPNREAPPEEYRNPAGLGRVDCDSGGLPEPDVECKSVTTLEDWLLEETKPGAGIPGFEGEEDGGS